MNDQDEPLCEKCGVTVAMEWQDVRDPDRWRHLCGRCAREWLTAEAHTDA